MRFQGDMRAHGPGRAAQASHAAAVFPMGTIVPFEPDILTSSQFWDRARSSCRSGEQRLTLAILEEAAKDIERPAVVGGAWGEVARRHHGNAMSEQALAWCLDEDTRWPFSFTNCCETVGLDVSYVRAGLLRLAARRGLGLAEAAVPGYPRRLRGAVESMVRVGTRGRGA